MRERAKRLKAEKLYLITTLRVILLLVQNEKLDQSMKNMLVKQFCEDALENCKRQPHG